MGAVGVAIAAAAAFALPALAASLSSTSGTLGSGASVVSQCDPDGIATTVNLSGTNVVGVTASGIAAACSEMTIKAVVSGDTSSSGSTIVPAGGGSTTVTLAAEVAMAQSMRIDLVVAP